MATTGRKGKIASIGNILENILDSTSATSIQVSSIKEGHIVRYF